MAEENETPGQSDPSDDGTRDTQENNCIPVDEDDLINTDGEEFAARYSASKQREIEKLSKEMEERKNLNTKAKKRNWWIKTVLMIILIGASIAIMFGLGKYLGGEDTKSFSEMIRGINLPFLCAFIGSILFYILIESAKYSYLLKISTGKFRFGASVKTMFLGKYYDGITPLGTGGQPFQIYYLHKKNIPAGVATAVPLVKYMVSTIVFCLVSVVLLAVTPRFFEGEKVVSDTITVTILVVAWISLAANLLIPLTIGLVSLFPKAGKKMIVGIVAFLHKIKIVKHKYPVTKKYVYEVSEYRNSLKMLIRNWWKLLPLVVITLLEIANYLILPFFTVLAIAGVEPTAKLLLQMCCLCVISFYSASLVPTPGNSGAVETTSSLVFITVAGIEPVLGWVVLFWRFATFYVYILAGVGINTFDIIRSAVRNRRAEKKH